MCLRCINDMSFCLQKLVDSVLAEQAASTLGLMAQPHPGLTTTVTHAALMGHFLFPVQDSYLIYRFYIGTEATVNAKTLLPSPQLWAPSRA